MVVYLQLPQPATILKIDDPLFEREKKGTENQRDRNTGEENYPWPESGKIQVVIDQPDNPVEKQRHELSKGTKNGDANQSDSTFPPEVQEPSRILPNPVGGE